MEPNVDSLLALGTYRVAQQLFPGENCPETPLKTPRVVSGKIG